MSIAIKAILEGVFILWKTNKLFLDYIENDKYKFLEMSHQIHQRPELGMKKFLHQGH